MTNAFKAKLCIMSNKCLNTNSDGETSSSLPLSVTAKRLSVDEQTLICSDNNNLRKELTIQTTLPSEVPTVNSTNHVNNIQLLSPPRSVGSIGGPADPVHDLPPELLQAGWRKFWSKREGRPYFFNKMTNESLWDMPRVGGGIDPITDPLGIQSEPPTPTEPVTPLTNIPAFPHFPRAGEKRSLSMDDSAYGPSNKV